MAIGKDKERVAITMSKAVLERLDAYCERAGMTRSQYISYAVAAKLDTEAETMQIARSAINKQMEKLFDIEKLFDMESLDALVQLMQRGGGNE